MLRAPDMDIWRGRIEADAPHRWHEVIRPWPDAPDAPAGTAILGCCCDEGVRRNQGRTGAREGPAALRRALANVVRPGGQHLYDAGDVLCQGEAMEAAQEALATRVAEILDRGDRPLIVGGGHEIALGSYLGITRHVPASDVIGIVNLDAHFDLRSPLPRGNSGSPFRQISEWCIAHARPFRYMVLGINPAANSTPLFEYASQNDVRWFTDLECTSAGLATIEHALNDYIAQVDHLYLSVCLDVLPAAAAPGVSAPGTPGVDPGTVMALIQLIKTLCSHHAVSLQLADIAELNPTYDIDERTARLAARLVHEIVN